MTKNVYEGLNFWFCPICSHIVQWAFWYLDFHNNFLICRWWSDHPGGYSHWESQCWSRSTKSLQYLFEAVCHLEGYWMLWMSISMRRFYLNIKCVQTSNRLTLVGFLWTLRTSLPSFQLLQFRRTILTLSQE